MKGLSIIAYARLLFHLIIIRPLLRLFFGVTVRGRRHLEGVDRFVIAANHNSHLDTLLIYSVLPYARVVRTHPVAARDYFSKSKLFYLLVETLFRPVWVDRDVHGGAAFEEMSRRVQAGESLILFPEGTRGEAGTIAPFRSGVGRLMAKHPDLPVLPAYLLGPERALPKQASLPLPVTNHIVIGPPMKVNGKPENLHVALQSRVEELARAELGRRQRRRKRRHPGGAFTVAVLGIDGSGKSTLSRKLAEELSRNGDSCLVSDQLELFGNGERLDMQPLLEEKLRVWLGRQAKSAKSLAAYKIPKLGEMLLRDRLQSESERWYDPCWLILDGSPLLNLAAWAALYREEEITSEFCADAIAFLSGRLAPEREAPLFKEFPEIRLFKQVGLTHLRRPDAVLFLEISAKDAMNRIHARGESKQVHETEEKLTRLAGAYRLVCETASRHIPIVTLSAAQPADELVREAKAFLVRTAAGELSGRGVSGGNDGG